MNTRRRGTLLGLAWGDALGCPVEGYRSGRIQQLYGDYDGLPEAYDVERLRVLLKPKQLKRLRPLGLHSDDTQQAMALIGAAAEGAFSPEHWASWLVAGHTGGAWRGIGRNFVAALHRLKRGMSPRRSGSPSAGMGAAMRVAPLAALLEGDALRDASMAQALVTHGDIRAASLCAAVTFTASRLIAGDAPRIIAAALPEATRAAEHAWRDRPLWTFDDAGADQLPDALARVLPRRNDTPEQLRAVISRAAKPHLRRGFTRAHPNQGFALLGGVHAIAMALREDAELDPQETLCEIIRQGFDTDTVAAICGGLLGARFGSGWIPRERLYDQTRIEAWAEVLDGGSPPEDIGAFVAAEAALTEAEVAFQREISR